MLRTGNNIRPMPSNTVVARPQAAFVGILACGMTYLLAMRELDLSVGVA